MSRIDAALRRVSRAFGGDWDPPEDGSVLERYAPDPAGRAAGWDHESDRPAPVPVRAAEREDTATIRTHTVASTRMGFGDAGSPFGRGLQGKVIVDPNTPRAAVQRYERLASALTDRYGSRGAGTLLVTSAVSSEGRTLTAVNLALALSVALSRRVLLVDADLQRPSLASVFGIRHGGGLGEFLRLERDDLTQHRISEHLTVVPAGRADPAAVMALTSDRMEDLIRHLAGPFDWVVLDAPPVQRMPEPELIGGIAGGVLFVVRAGMAPRTYVRRAIDLLGHHRIVGIVMNDVTSGADAANDPDGKAEGSILI